MQKQILNDLTFGFEIEGYFKKGLKEKIKGCWKTDGSVHLDYHSAPFSDFEFCGTNTGEDTECSNCEGSGHLEDECDCERDELTCERTEHAHDVLCYRDTIQETDGDIVNVIREIICDQDEHEHDSYACFTTSCSDSDDYHQVDCHHCSGTGNIDDEEDTGSYSSEFNSRKYESVTEVLQDLNLFNKKNYVFNETCGLHFHVGMKDGNYQKLFSVASNWELMGKLQKEALNYCECQKTRLQTKNDFCRPFESKEHVINNTKNVNINYRSNKYLFCRFHPETKTLEFRFFSPCPHKVKNVKRLLSSLSDYLNSKEKIKVLRNADTTIKYEVLEVVREVEMGKSELKEMKKELFEEIKHACPNYELDEYHQEQAEILYNRGIKKLLQNWAITMMKRDFKILPPDPTDVWVYIARGERNNEAILQNKRTKEIRCYYTEVVQDADSTINRTVLTPSWHYPRTNYELSQAAAYLGILESDCYRLFEMHREREGAQMSTDLLPMCQAFQDFTDSGTFYSYGMDTSPIGQASYGSATLTERDMRRGIEAMRNINLNAGARIVGSAGLEDNV